MEESHVNKCPLAPTVAPPPPALCSPPINYLLRANMGVFDRRVMCILSQFHLAKLNFYFVVCFCCSDRNCTRRYLNSGCLNLGFIYIQKCIVIDAKKNRAVMSTFLAP